MFSVLPVCHTSYRAGMCHQSLVTSPGELQASQSADSRFQGLKHAIICKQIKVAPGLALLECLTSFAGLLVGWLAGLLICLSAMFKAAGVQVAVLLVSWLAGWLVSSLVGWLAMDATVSAFY